MCVESENVVSKLQGGWNRAQLKKKRQYIGKNIKQHCDEIQMHRKTHLLLIMYKLKIRHYVNVCYDDMKIYYFQ